MKKLTLLSILIIGLTISATSQTQVSDRFACPNENRDTLFVMSDMFNIMTSLWNEPCNIKDKPMIVSVKVLDPNVIKLISSKTSYPASNSA